VDLFGQSKGKVVVAGSTRDNENEVQLAAKEQEVKVDQEEKK
jgi:hypothetical protein